QSNFLLDLDSDTLPACFVKEGDGWYAIFNPQQSRLLDIDLMYNLNHQSVVCCVRFALNGRFLATGCNHYAQVFDVETGEPVSRLQGDSLPEEGDKYIRSVCFSPDGRYLAGGSEDSVLYVWDIAARMIKHRFTGHEAEIYSVDFARNGRFIASGSGDRSVCLWDLDSNSRIAYFPIQDGVSSVAISPDNLFVAASSLDNTVPVWDVQSRQLVVCFEDADSHIDSTYSVAFAPSGNRLFSGSLDKTVKMWEFTPTSSLSETSPIGRCVRTFEGHKDFVFSVAITQDSNWVLSGSKDRTVYFWDPHTGVSHVMLNGHKKSVISVASSPTNGIFATGSGDMCARIWRFSRYSGP
ncbi:chromatin associated protein, partial [Periconia macrospinosa]